MSLLMEALRKAEQGKSRTTNAVDFTVHTNEEPSSEQEGNGLNLESDDLIETAGPELESNPELKSVSELKSKSIQVPELELVEEEKTGDRTDIVLQEKTERASVADSSKIHESEGEKILNIEPETEGESESKSLPGPAHISISNQPESQSASNTEGSDSGTAIPAEPGGIPEQVPSNTPSNGSSVTKSTAMVSEEQVRRSARNVFSAKKDSRHLPRRRLFIFGLVGVLTLLIVAGYLFYVSSKMAPSANMLINVDQTQEALDEVRILDETAENDASSSENSPETGIPSDTMVDNTQQQSQNQSDGPTGQSEGVSQSDIHSSSTLSGESKEKAGMEILADKSESSSGIEMLSAPMPVSKFDSNQNQLNDHLPEQKTVFSTQKIPVTITRQATSPEVNPLMTEAYEDYQVGEFEQSKGKFKQVLQVDPRHRGALFGLAAIAFQQGDAYLARDHYLRLLELNPEDPLARANLLAIMPAGDAARQESELKFLLKDHPHVPALFFSLGSLYASQQQWNEAQDAYYKALQAAKNQVSRQDMVHPDYPFNLAVSLEHLNKRQLAVKYYQDALQLAAGHSTGFDTEALRNRLNQLKGTEAP